MIRMLVLLLGIPACASAQNPADAARGSGSVPYAMVRNPTSGVEMPRITLAGRPAVEKRVNDALDSLAADLRCSEGDDGEYETRVAVTHAADDVLSVLIGSSYYCGGAYFTNHADSSLTFDLRTGESVPFKALFADYERDRAAITAAFAKSLPAKDLEGCEAELGVEGLSEQSFAYTISAKGLRLETSFPHVIEACNRDSTLPFASLRAFAAPDGILLRVAGAPAGR